MKYIGSLGSAVDINRVAISGDWHMNGPWAAKQIQMAADAGASKLIQVGDFGLWPGFEGVKFLDQVNRAAEYCSVTVYAVRGNHDSNYWEHVLGSHFYPECPMTGGKYVRSNIVLLPRVGGFWMGGGNGRRRFFVAGGAASIDRDSRIPGESWWPEELLTDNEVNGINESKVDILLTHDASTRTPFGFVLYQDNESLFNRSRIDRVIDKVSPDMHFHGHYHRKYEWQNVTSRYHWIETFGLDMDGTPWNTGVLDMAEMKFRWLSQE